MSVCVRPSRYFAFSASLPKLLSSFAQPSVTLIGQPMPNSVWLNRNVNACLATTGYLSGQPRMPLRIDIAIGRVILDPLCIAAELIALMQHRRVAVGEPCAFVEMAAGHGAETIMM